MAACGFWWRPTSSPARSPRSRRPRRSPPGWRRRAPDDELDLAPMSDGGPGFVDVLHEALGGELLAVTVRGPHGDADPGHRPASPATTAYVESAQACGLHLTGAEGAETRHDVRRRRAGRRRDRRRRHDRVVSGSAGAAPTTAAPGCWRPWAPPPTVPLDAGGAGLDGVTTVDVSAARERFDVELVAASDVDNPLTGLFGATKVFGPQKGIPEERLPTGRRLAGAVRRRAGPPDRAGEGRRRGRRPRLRPAGCSAPPASPGSTLVAEAVDLAERARAADLVLTGEGAFDFSSRAGKVPYGVAEVAEEALRPCVALAGQVLVGSREMRALGIESAYSLVDLVGEERAFADPAGALAELAARAARTWSR